MFKKIYLALLSCFLFVLSSEAATFDLPGDGATIVGSTKAAQTIAGDTLTSIARRYSMGIMELVEANPKFKIGYSYSPGKPILIPSQFILPDAAHKGIVVNVAELRLYFYPPGTRQVITFPVGVGREGWNTPLGLTYVASKVKDPTWVVPADIKADRLKDGVVLPDSVGPGPDNPLGPYKLILGVPELRIHGSNDPSGIGRRSSSGCIRMQPEAIESFFSLIPDNLPVMIVDQPIKVGWLKNDLYIEVHIPLGDDPDSDDQTLLQDMHHIVEAEMAKRPANVDWGAAEKATEEQRGYPVKIGEGTGAVPNIAVPLNPNAPAAKVVNAVHARKTIEKKKHDKKETSKKKHSWF